LRLARCVVEERWPLRRWGPARINLPVGSEPLDRASSPGPLQGRTAGASGSGDRPGAVDDHSRLAPHLQSPPRPHRIQRSTTHHPRPGGRHHPAQTGRESENRSGATDKVAAEAEGILDAPPPCRVPDPVSRTYCGFGYARTASPAPGTAQRCQTGPHPGSLQSTAAFAACDQPATSPWLLMATAALSVRRSA
jgi:hypothetical protein